jgi:hypothetical protein
MDEWVPVADAADVTTKPRAVLIDGHRIEPFSEAGLRDTHQTWVREPATGVYRLGHLWLDRLDHPR